MVDEYVTPLKLWLVGIFVPAFFFLFHYYLFRDDHELYNSLMSVSLAICLNAAFVDGIKIAVGEYLFLLSRYFFCTAIIGFVFIEQVYGLCIHIQ